MQPGITAIEQAMANYIASHGSVAAIAWDNQNTVVYCNKAFIDMLQIDFAAVGKSVFDFLRFPDYPECKFGTLTEPIQSPVSLNTVQGEYRCDSTVFPLENGYIAFCGRPVLLQSDIVEKMAKMNLELTNLSWESQKNNRKTEKINEQLQREIAERKQVEEALRLSEERYHALIMQSSDAVALVDLETMTIVENNPRFEKMTGYTPSAQNPLRVQDLFDDSLVNIMRYLDQLHATGALPPTIRKIKTSAGRPLLVERSSSLIKVAGRLYQFAVFRDVTQEMERQRELKKDLTLASQVQRTLLPTTPRSGHFQIQTVFRPQGFVSGDVYHMVWREQEKKLRGFLVDITGHGLATALQTAAVNVLMHEVMEMTLPMTLSDQLAWLNQRISRYIDETSFAAAIAFELDFSRGELRYAAAGITDFLFNQTQISAPGLFLGINENEAYETKQLSFSPGDSVCFMTDGITDVLTSDHAWGNITAKEICSLFGEEQQLAKVKDDATAICITVMDSANQEQQKGWQV